MNRVSALLRVLQVLQTIDPEFPLQYAVCLALISQDEGLSLTELAKRAEVSLSTASRIVGALSQYRQSGQPYNLVVVHIAPEERRRKEIFLSPSGQRVMEEVAQALHNLPERTRKQA